MLNIRLYLFANVMMAWLALTVYLLEQAFHIYIPKNPFNAYRFVISRVDRYLCPPPLQDPFPEPIPATEGAITVNIVEFASLPAISDGRAVPMMLLVDEPGTGRLFVNDQSGVLYSVSYDGRTVVPYLDHTDALWGIKVLRKNFWPRDMRELRGFHSFAFHPQFAEAGTSGFGRFYTLVESRNETDDLLLLEWTAADPYAAFYDGGPPRELMRKPCVKDHCSGMLGFNPSATPGDTDFGLLYMSIGDGLNPAWSQDLSNLFGKILRIDPLGSNSTNGQYGIPVDNPFVSTRNALAEIYAYGMRHPQRFGWDVRNGNLFVADIGEWQVEEISLVTAGANLGWPNWEGSFLLFDDWRDDWRIVFRLVRNVDWKIRGKWPLESIWPEAYPVLSLDNLRSDDASITYPVVEFDHKDPLLGRGFVGVAITGVVVYRHAAIPQLENTVLFGELVSGEVFSFPADDLPEGGQAAIRRVRFEHRGETKTLLQMIQEKNIVQGREPARRADLRFGTGPNGQIFLLNKQDGIIRRLMP